MRKNCTPRSVRGAPGNRCPYRGGFIQQLAPFAKMDTYQDPKPGKTYISPKLDSFGEPQRKVRIATKLIEQPETYARTEI